MQFVRMSEHLSDSLWDIITREKAQQTGLNHLECSFLLFYFLSFVIIGQSHLNSDSIWQFPSTGTRQHSFNNNYYLAGCIRCSNTELQSNNEKEVLISV